MSNRYRLTFKKEKAGPIKGLLALVSDLPYALAVIASSFVLAFLLHMFVSVHP